MAHPLCPPSCVSSAISEMVKCEHERAVHLFVDSLVNQDKPSFAFQCTDPNRFKRGICLSCRKNRCNNIGYNAKKMRKKRNSKMYLKTRAGMPFRGNSPFRSQVPLSLSLPLYFPAKQNVQLQPREAVVYLAIASYCKSDHVMHALVEWLLGNPGLGPFCDTTTP